MIQDITIVKLIEFFMFGSYYLTTRFIVINIELLIILYVSQLSAGILYPYSLALYIWKLK